MRQIVWAFAALAAALGMCSCASCDGGHFLAPGVAAEAHNGPPRAGWRTEWPMPVPTHTHPGPGGIQKASYASSATPPANTMPEPALTPGVVRPLTQAEVCAQRWGRDERHVTAAMKRAVFAAYGFTGNLDPRCISDGHKNHRCEIDHLISRELGGADDVRNLWPEPYGGPWNAHDKDRLENRLHQEVCDLHTLTLEQAQDLIRTDWRSAYRARFGEPRSAVALPSI